MQSVSSRSTSHLQDMVHEYLTLEFDQLGLPVSWEREVLLSTKDCTCQRVEGPQGVWLLRHELKTSQSELHSTKARVVYRSRLPDGFDEAIQTLRLPGVSVVVVPRDIQDGSVSLGQRTIMGLRCEGREYRFGDMRWRKWLHGAQTEVFCELLVNNRVAALTVLTRMSKPTKTDTEIMQIPGHLPVKQVSAAQFMRLMAGFGRIRL